MKSIVVQASCLSKKHGQSLRVTKATYNNHANRLD